ncbi:Crp/Fnr family transcriptional regulator [Mucilaginibacter arboris]|uniref:Cyclic nucleotide-binding domain-containing protein n=1 Tax=Mucilaginibacter arboris TaxID=2682090 RepID=A0A7K1SSP5_9SPHI|nr:Crp/Fnr family transcriptional regulator [Mucilaginibacter arboris]MVN20332.1 cyclic nucleotide-binding domain-containing protein [Mucilaginibacter arboris]
MFEAFDKNISNHVNLSTDELDLVHHLFQHKTYRKKTLLLSEGQVCNFEAYLVKGCVKRYYIDPNGDEVILQFAVEDWWVSDMVSFTEQVPSHLYIETIEETELLQITYPNKELLFKQVPQLERVFRLLVQRAYSVLENRFFTGLTASAEERYLNFIKKYPILPQRVPQYQIASYLGITPEALSRIRASLLRKK